MARPKRSTEVEAENAQLRELLVQAGVTAQADMVAAQLQATLISELHHRVKNTLAIASAIVAQTLRTATNTQDAAAAIADRLQALSLAHDLLLSQSWTGVGCRSLVEQATRTFQSTDGKRLDIEGEDIKVASGPAISVSMLLHELCTNALKYGALSVPDGRVRTVWTADGPADRFRLMWTEIGGPPVSPPSRQSFGTRLIEQALPGQLSGEARLTYTPAGLVCEVNVPMASLREPAAAR